MEIFVYCNKDGEFAREGSEFRELQICNEDEKNMNSIIKNSIKNNLVISIVHILDKEVFLELRNKEEEWEKEQGNEKAKMQIVKCKMRM